MVLGDVTAYVALSRSVTILPESRLGTFILETVDDSVYGGGVTETLVFVLTGASGGVTLGPVVKHTVTVIDDEAPVVPEPPAVEVVTATLRVSELSGIRRRYDDSQHRPF